MKKSLLFSISVLASVTVFSANFSSFAGNCCFKGEKQDDADSSRPIKKPTSPPKSQQAPLASSQAEKRSSPRSSPRSSGVVLPSSTAGNAATPNEREALISDAQRRISAERERQERERREIQQAAASSGALTQDAEFARVQEQLAETERQLALERERTAELLPVLHSCHAVLAALTEQGVECTVTEGDKGSRLTLLIPEGPSTIFFAATRADILQDRTLRRTVSGALSTNPQTSLNVDRRQDAIATELQTIGRRLTTSSGEGPLRTRLQELFASVARTIDNAGSGDVRRARGDSATPNLTLVSLQEEGAAFILGVSNSSTPKFSQDPLSVDSDRKRKIEARPGGKGVFSLSLDTVRTPLLSLAASSDDDDRQ